MTKDERIVYRIIDFFYRLNNRLAKHFARRTSKLKHIKYCLEFGERDDDIYIITYPKSGTTWMQMILYQLTTDGNMDFEHIYDVSPWIKNESYLNKAPRELPSKTKAI